MSAGTAHVFYPRADAKECTAALLLDLDPLALSRDGFVSDRPYAAGSLLAVAMGAVFGSALKGRCAQRPELAEAAIPLVVRLPTLACAGADALGPAEARDSAVALVERLFTPLGWTIEAAPVPLDPAFPEWGDSRYLDTTLTGELRLADALTHSTSCCRSSTVTSTTGWAPTRSASCCAPASAGSPVTRTAP